MPRPQHTVWWLLQIDPVFNAEEKIDLDAPLSDAWPALQFTPPLDAKRTSLRDFLAMRPGIENSTLNYRSGALGNIDDEQEVLRVLAVYSREQPRTFQYSNMSYEVAARVMHKLTGKRWQELLHEKIFVPLAMTSTTTSPPAAEVPIPWLYRSSAPNVSVRLVDKTSATMGPAGGMFTTTGTTASWSRCALCSTKRTCRCVSSGMSATSSAFASLHLLSEPVQAAPLRQSHESRIYNVGGGTTAWLAAGLPSEHAA